MAELSTRQIQELEKLHIHTTASAAPDCTLDALKDSSAADPLLVQLMDVYQAPTRPVAASILTRRFGFLFTALLKLVTADGLLWKGTLADISIVQQDGQLGFVLDPRQFQEVHDTDHTEAFRELIQQLGNPVIQGVGQHVKLSKYIMWENVWGYVIWMYDQLLRHPAIHEKAKVDVQLLLEDEIWRPALKSSPFRRFLQGETVEEAAQHYQRMTCCLFKEIPGKEKCPYCPLVGR